ncbi:MAG: putative bifunctional diguanylate cyclase/phosphodiesterase, partial [Comamonas sp.]
PNRTMFNECAQQTLHAYRGETGVLFFLDLDRFKLWNDSLGHAAGDALLCEVARRLSECTRPEDVVGRLSSDEFAVLMPSCSPEHIPQLAQRLLDAVAKPFSVQGVLTTPNACIGVCSFPEDGTDVETLLRHADQAMYVAKSRGSQHWERYQPVMGQLNQERAHMERDLRHTLAAGGLQLFFQPQVRGAGAQGLYGLEALARWHHPEWGWVSPPRFIAVAEDTGMIHDLTGWLLHAACAQLVLWRAQGIAVPHISINLSTNNFHDPTFAHKVQACLQQHGLQSSDLVLEITESVMLDSSHATQNNLQALHAAGLRLAMDDFGTGYSSLSYLHRLPISELKLDKSFVHDVTTSSAAGALTRSVLNIATSLGMTVVAEGVETADQAQWLRQHGCPVLQGYLFARPMPPQELPAWLDTAFTA